MSKKYMEYEDLVYYDKKIKEYIDNFSGDAECDVTKEYVDNQDTKINDKIGNLPNLKTNDKSNIVNAINELFQNVDNGKDLIASAITDKGVDTSKDVTFVTMANNILSIITGGDLTPIHEAMEDLGYNFSDLSKADGEETGQILSKWFILKPYSDGTEILLDSTKDSTFNSWMIENGLKDFGYYINPNCITKAIDVTENLNTGLYISEEIEDIKLTKIYQGGV